MESQKDELCFELRTMLAAWHGALLNPEVTSNKIEQIRRKIHEICNKLDELDR